MLGFSRKIVKLRIPILVLSLVLLIPSAIGFIKTRINYDILYYLPDNIETMQGQDILMDDFGKGAYAIFVCEDMTDKDAAKLKSKVEKVDHVVSVLSLTDVDIPKEVLPEKVKDIFYSRDGNGQLMFLFFDTTTSADETLDAIEELYDLAGKQCFVSSMSAIVTDTRDLVNKEVFIYVLIAVIMSTIVMALFMDSFLIPVLFLIDIGIAIIYNLGTNFIKGEISFITMALVAVLQLAVTMDYSIFLYHSYKEEKQTYPDNKEAMAHAITATISSVAGSSLTTIAGFIALCFMSFTLGMDLGVVMAKGVVLGVICCVTVLPALLLFFDKAIRKTAHKPLTLPLGKLPGFVTKHYRILVLLMILLWIPGIYGNSNYNVYYKLDASLPDYLNSVQANARLEEGYDMNSISMLLVDAELPHKKAKAMLDDLQNVKGVNFAVGLDSIAGTTLPEEIIPEKVKETLQSDNWKLMLVSSKYQVATDEVNEQCDEVNSIIKSYDPGAMLIGEAACTKDLIEITDHDFKVVNAVSIGAIFILILIVLRSISLPVILVLVIELAIFLNLGTAFYTNVTLPFIAPITIGTIQLGATVDYAILMTTRYKRERNQGADKNTAVQIALKTSAHSIITSALGFFAATIGVGVYSDVDLIGSLCLLMARGALISMVMVLVFLPSLLRLLDGLIVHTTLGIKPKRIR